MTPIITVTFPSLELRAPDTGERIVEGIVVPYNETSYLTEDPNGERFLPGSFNRTVKERPKVKLFRSHRHDDAIGKSIEWKASDERGLWGRFHVPPGDDGDSALEKVRNGLLDAFSIGFRPIRVRRGADGVREVQEAALHEVSLVPIGAYDGAKVLALRAPAPVFVVPMPDVNLAPIPIVRHWQ